GVGQSSWGPVVYGVTDTRHADEAEAAAEDALADRGLEGRVILAEPAEGGARVRVDGNDR
ncbi:GHMP kinase, partial [Natrinema soli]